MYFLLKIKKFIVKILTCWILSKKIRRNARNFLFYFSLYDFFQFRKQNFKIVSLGNNCLPKVLTTAVKLKPRKIYGEKNCPFDLSIHANLQKITEQIQNNFKNYFDGLVKNETWENPNLDARYPHDRYLTKEKFIQRYKIRIANFNEIINSKKNLYFIYSNYDNEIETHEIINLYNTIEQKRNGKQFKIILLLAKKVNNIDNSNIIQLIDDFKIEDANWVESFINDYGNINNKYTDYCLKTGKKLSEIIKKRQS